MNVLRSDHSWQKVLRNAIPERLMPKHVVTAMTAWVALFSLFGVQWSLPSTKQNQYFAACDLSLVASSVMGTYKYPVMPWFTRHPDEILIPSALANMSFRPLDLDPGHYEYPTFHSYLTAGVVFSTAKAGLFRLTGDKEFYAEHPTDMARLIMAGRLLCVLMGIATLWVNYATSRKLGAPWAGAIAAISLASSPLWVRDSTFMLVNVPLGFWGAVVFYYSITYLDEMRQGRRNDRPLWLASIAVGLAAGTKYPGLALASVPIAAAALSASLQSPNRTRELSQLAMKCVVVVAIVIIALFASSPYVFLNWGQAVADTDKTRGSLRTFNILSTTAFMAANGIPYTLFLGVGVAATFRRFLRFEAAPSLLALWCLATMLTPLASAFTYARYWVPFLPAAAMCCGYLCAAPGPGHPLPLRGLVVAVAACFPSAIVGASVLARMGATDPLGDVSAWLHANVPAGATVAVRDTATELPIVDCRKYRVIDLRDTCPAVGIMGDADVLVTANPELLNDIGIADVLKLVDYTTSPPWLFPRSWSASDWRYTSNVCAVYPLKAALRSLSDRHQLAEDCDSVCKSGGRVIELSGVTFLGFDPNQPTRFPPGSYSTNDQRLVINEKNKSDWMGIQWSRHSAASSGPCGCPAIVRISECRDILKTLEKGDVLALEGLVVPLPDPPGYGLVLVTLKCVR